MDKKKGSSAGDGAQPGRGRRGRRGQRGQRGRAAVAVTGGPSPRGGRWIAACGRLRAPAGAGSGLAVKS